MKYSFVMESPWEESKGCTPVDLFPTEVRPYLEFKNIINFSRVSQPLHFTFKLLQLISGSLNCRATVWYWNDFNVHVYIYSPVISKYAPTRNYSTELLSVHYPGPIAFNQGQSPGRFTRTTRISGHLAWNDEPVIFFSEVSVTLSLKVCLIHCGVTFVHSWTGRKKLTS